TPPQEREREAVLWRCRTLDTTALEQRLTGGRRGQGKSATRLQQEAELKELGEAFPEYAALHSHVLQDKTWWRASTGPIRRASGASKRGRTPAFRACRGGGGITPSPAKSMAPARGWTMACWSSPRVAGSPCSGVA